MEAQNKVTKGTEAWTPLCLYLRLLVIGREILVLNTDSGTGHDATLPESSLP